MTAKAALCKALLAGEVLNIKNVFNLIGLTNCPREISRMVEKPFNVQVSRTPMNGTSKYGQSVTWVNYRLNYTEYNQEGIKKMLAYIQEQQGTLPPAKTSIDDKQRKAINTMAMAAGVTQRNLFL